ncbi:MAG: 2-hydroxychromene-2-carboxylate isomerase [Magnetovibrionaceae bacterium]
MSQSEFEPVDFYFDFSSPYAYFASTRIDKVAERGGRKCRWKPILLGPVFKATGNALLITQPMKGEYSRMDWDRMARFMEIPYQFPAKFPINTMRAARLYYWLHDTDCSKARDFARAVFKAYFADGIDVSGIEATLDVAQSVGVDRAEAEAAILDEANKQRLKDEVDAAIERGVIGAPFFFVDGEGYWGSDRMWMIKKVLAGKQAF